MGAGRGADGGGVPAGVGLEEFVAHCWVVTVVGRRVVVRGCGGAGLGGCGEGRTGGWCDEVVRVKVEVEVNGVALEGMVAIHVVDV